MKNKIHSKSKGFSAFKSWIKNKFSQKNLKQFFAGTSTAKKMFRIYFFILLIVAIFLYLPISLKPFLLEGFGGEVYNLRYFDNAYHMDILDPMTGVVNVISFNFLNSLFMAFSGFSDTGLSLYTLSDVFSVFGNIVLMLAVQIGGFGIMFFIFLIWKTFKISNKVSINQTLLAQSEKGNTKIGNTDRMLVSSAIIILVIEVIFAIFYSLWFLYVPAYQQIVIAGDKTVDSQTYMYVYNNAGDAFFAGFFHSVTVVNNSGFDILGPNSLGAYRNGVHTIFLMATASQFMLGGIGFPIVYDFLQKLTFKWTKCTHWYFSWFKLEISINKQHRISLFTRLSIVTYFIVALIGVVFVFLFECTVLGGGVGQIWSDTSGMFGNGDSALTYYNKSISLIFQSLSTRSAGYATFSNTLLNPSTKWLYIVLMFIGGSPSSTAGGIRTTTLALIVLTIWSRLRGYATVNVFKRQIRQVDYVNSFIVFIVSIALLLIGFLVITASNWRVVSLDNQADFFTNTIFVCTSAFGTTGLSMAATGLQDWPSLVYLMILMFVGQLGVGSTILAFNRNKVKVNLFTYRTEDVRIG